MLADLSGTFSLESIAEELSNRPRAVFGFLTPKAYSNTYSQLMLLPPLETSSSPPFPATTSKPPNQATDSNDRTHQGQASKVV